MKKFSLIIFAFLLFQQINAQQSNLGKTRPENVSKGIVYNNLNKNQKIVNNVPTYIWHRGCGPTALGMVIGYWTNIGFSDLIFGDVSTQTEYVNNTIATQEHYDDYSLPIDYYPDLFQDKSDLGGAHTSNCIADFMETSWSSENNRYGWSWAYKIADAFTNYIQMINSNYETYTQNVFFNTTSWDNYKFEIDNDRPVVLLVDTDGDGNTDHFVTGIGYDEENSAYGIYDTWDNNIHWYEWRGLASGNDWGIYGFNILRITSDVSVGNNMENKVKIYPIPAKDFINIEFASNTNLSNVNISVINSLGREILNNNCKINSKLDISKVKNGIYFLNINSEGKKIITKKIIILR